MKLLEDKKEAKVKENHTLTRKAIKEFIDISYKPTELKLNGKEIKTLLAFDKEFINLKTTLKTNNLVGSEAIKTKKIEAFLNKMKSEAELKVREVIEEL